MQTGSKAEEDDAAWLNFGAWHLRSARPWKAAQYSHAILRIETHIAAQPLNILEAVYSSGTAAVLLNNEDFLFFETIEQAHMMGRDDELCVQWVALARPEQAKQFVHDVHMQIAVDFVEDGQSGPVECEFDRGQ